VYINDIYVTLKSCPLLRKHHLCTLCKDCANCVYSVYSVQ